MLGDVDGVDEESNTLLAPDVDGDEDEFDGCGGVRGVVEGQTLSLLGCDFCSEEWERWGGSEFS